MKKRNFGEMIAYFNRRVADMDIAQKYKMDLLGMITAIEFEHDSENPEWTPVTECLPEEEEDVLVTVRFDGIAKKEKPTYYVEVAHQNDGEWLSYSDEWKVLRHRHHVVAWKPLPEPWRGE